MKKPNRIRNNLKSSDRLLNREQGGGSPELTQRERIELARERQAQKEADTKSALSKPSELTPLQRKRLERSEAIKQERGERLSNEELNNLPPSRFNKYLNTATGKPKKETHLTHYRSLKGGAKNFRDTQHPQLIALIAEYKSTGKGTGDSVKLAIRQLRQTQALSCELCNRIEKDRQFSKLSDKQADKAIAEKSN